MESMRTPFLGARVNVILFRERYGKTPWTGVELAAMAEVNTAESCRTVSGLLLPHSTAEADRRMSAR
jgi:hypothetical protein